MAFSNRILLLCAAALAFLLATPSHADTFIHTGQTLRNYEGLRLGNYFFVMQSDCNLVLYDTGKSIWATKTNGRGNSCFLILQSDGNLVIYNNGHQFIWASDSNVGDGNYALVLQANRNVVLYALSGGYRAIWSTGTNITIGDIIYKQHNTLTVDGK